MINSNSLNSIKLNQCDYFIAVYVLYQLQNIVYPVGIINQALQALLIIWSLEVSGKYLIPANCTSPILKATCYLLWMYIIYGVLYILFPLDNASFLPVPYTYLQRSLNSLLPILTFYEYGKRGLLINKKFVYYLIIYFILAVSHYYLSYNLLLKSAIERGSTRTEFTNNTGYEFLGLIPLIPFVRNKLIQYIFLVSIMLFIFIAFKRGAILIGVLCSIYFLYRDIRYTESVKKRFLFFLTTLTIVITACYFLQNLYNESAYFRSRVEQTQSGNMSKRDILYEKITHSYVDSHSYIELFFGKAANSTIAAAGNYAHQDFLETIHNNGLIGLFLLVYFYVAIIKTIRIISHQYNENKKVLICSLYILFIISFGKALFSMSIQNLEFSVSMLLGYFSYISDSKYAYLYNQ